MTTSSSSWAGAARYGEFEIVGASENIPHLLGEGSFGRTFEAYRTDQVAGEELREYVAIKILNPEMLQEEAKRFRFIQEILALSKLKHPNLIHYIRSGEEHGEVYYAMELCRGGDLSGLVRRFGALPERAVALIGMQIAAGLREMHQRHRLIHRDIKPSNIVLVDELGPEIELRHLAYRFEQQESLCRIVDFGLVELALSAGEQAQRFAGSPMFASPEQIREHPLDGRSDIYSLGMTLWYLVQGKGPLLDANGEEVRDHREALLRHTEMEEHEEAMPPHLSPQFRRILLQMVAKDPSRRFAQAADLRKALRQFLGEFPDHAIAGWSAEKEAPPGMTGASAMPTSEVAGSARKTSAARTGPVAGARSSKDWAGSAGGRSPEREAVIHGLPLPLKGDATRSTSATMIDPLTFGSPQPAPPPHPDGVRSTAAEWQTSLTEALRTLRAGGPGRVWSAAGAIVLGLFFLWGVWRLTHPAKAPPPVFVARKAREPNPSSGKILLEPKAAQNGPEAARVLNASLTPYRAGQNWENSLGMRFAPTPDGSAAMSVWVTRVGDFTAFTTATGYDAEAEMLSFQPNGWGMTKASWRSPGFFQTPNHPVVGISLDDARAFCRWLTQKERMERLIDTKVEYRLPTDDEWGRAAGVTRYPWGNAWPPPSGSGNFAGEEVANRLGGAEYIAGYKDGFATTSPVGSFSPNAAGFYDMGGNVCQWCESRFDPALNPPEIRRKIAEAASSAGTSPQMVLRGSSCFDGAEELLRLSVRRGAPGDLRAASLGFRAVLADVATAPALTTETLATAAPAAQPPETAPEKSVAANGEMTKPAGTEEPATEETDPENGAAANAAVDPQLAGIWTKKEAGGKVQKLSVEASGRYVYTGATAGAGWLVASGGKVRETPDSGRPPIDIPYEIRGGVLILTNLDGTSSEWRRTGDAVVTKHRRRGSHSTPPPSGISGFFHNLFHKKGER